jgi:flagellar motor switch protein FliN/FliY
MAGENVTFLNELQVEVTVELGRTRLTIRELAEMSQGQVIELDQAADKPLSLLASGQVFARGELVMVGDNGDRLGLRITEMVSADNGLARKSA